MQHNTSQKTNPAPHDTFIRLPAVMQKTALSRSSVYGLMKAKKFPQNIKLGERAAAWLESEINAWINDRISASRSQPQAGG